MDEPLEVCGNCGALLDVNTKVIETRTLNAPSTVSGYIHADTMVCAKIREAKFIGKLWKNS